MLVTTCIARTTLFFVGLGSLLTHVLTLNTNHNESCVILYEKGVEAYLDNKYEECVNYFEDALQKYRSYKKLLNNCRLKCKQEAELSDPMFPVDIENLLFYERTIRATLCIMKCKNEHSDIFDNTQLNFETEQLFEDQKPYEYIHICYFQTKDFQKAASSAFTFLVTHPDDKIMLGNLKHYSQMEGVSLNDIINYEAKDYVYLYVHGADAYEKKDWKPVEYNMEESLISYIQTEEECRANCEGPFDHGWYPDFIPSIANHFTMVLKCKMGCREKLNSLNGEKHDDLFPSHYHYLQYAYFKMGNLKETCRAVASYLLFYPDDNTMLDNMKYYRSLPKVDNDYFRPRDEAVRYVQRQKYEGKIMKFIINEYKFKGIEKLKDNASKRKFRIVMTEKQLQGPNRFLSDGLATTMECRSLVEIAKMFAILGDGYQGKKSPHTVMEKFEGVTLGRAALLVYIGLLNSKYLDLYLKITENVRKEIQDYFQIKQKLDFSYTHLVCRSALPDSPKNRTDYSHAVHADNCNILDNGVCEKLPPAFTWRDYSAILYLNSNFEGGEFIFTSDPNAERVQSVITPKCGRMIGFSSGGENLHGVKAVKRGSRCAIGMWFTYDQNHTEVDRQLAYQVLNMSKYY